MFEKLSIVADIHGNAFALESVLLSAQQRGLRRFVPGVIYRLGRKLISGLSPIGPRRDGMEPSATALTIRKRCTAFCTHPHKDVVAFSKRRPIPRRSQTPVGIN